MARPRRTWSELTDTQKVLVVVAGTVQVALAAAAWGDLARRPPERVNGSKGLWTAVIAINFFGPILYFLRGRRPAEVEAPTPLPQSEPEVSSAAQ
jgi:hypothetical protein